MKGRRKSKYNFPIIRFYHNELNLEHDYNTTYFLITETRDGVPQKIYTFRIPDSYKDDRLLGKLNERYCRYCPN